MVSRKSLETAEARKYEARPVGFMFAKFGLVISICSSIIHARENIK